MTETRERCIDGSSCAPARRKRAWAVALPHRSPPGPECSILLLPAETTHQGVSRVRLIPRHIHAKLTLETTSNGPSMWQPRSHAHAWIESAVTRGRPAT